MPEPMSKRDEAIEATAKALVEWESDQCERDTEGEAYLDRWDVLDEKARQDYREQARAVLAALRVEPDEPGRWPKEMPDERKAGDEPHKESGEPDEGERDWWERMLDEAARAIAKKWPLAFRPEPLAFAREVALDAIQTYQFLSDLRAKDEPLGEREYPLNWCLFEAGYKAAMLENPRGAEARLREALQHVLDVLGPNGGTCRENVCEGCKYEMTEAVDTARAALQEKQ
jgi:hypothetical protein